MKERDTRTSEKQRTENLRLVTEFPLSEKDEVAAASQRTRQLYEEWEKLKKMEDYDGKAK
ncbi:hypothetical protein [Mucilaginibacter panaciglaebae]|uniref:Uncharacterized protein n=1 Tax=Mucilaginibacter panaciglaebae TaxID=502331 RepID=A0ABP7WRH1_9SPHI